MTRGTDIVGLILSAGASSRMKFHKALLKIGNKTLLEDQVRRIRESGINDIYIVVGCKSEEIKNHHKDLDVVWIENKNWRDGNFSSVLCGLLNIVLSESACHCEEAGGQRGNPANIWGVILLPIDTVGVEVDTIKLIIDSGLKSGSNIIPTHKGRGGHPVFLTKELISEIITTKTPNDRLDQILNAAKSTSRTEVETDAILNNINADEDYRRIRED